MLSSCVDPRKLASPNLSSSYSVQLRAPSTDMCNLQAQLPFKQLWSLSQEGDLLLFPLAPRTPPGARTAVSSTGLSPQQLGPSKEETTGAQMCRERARL